MKVAICQFDPTMHSGLIYSSYPKGIYYGCGVNKHDKGTPEYKAFKAIWFKEFHLKMSSLLKDATIYVACIQNDPDTLLGYSIIYKDTLEFVYVKELFRTQGIATLLTKDKYTKVATPITKVGLTIISKNPQYNKENLNDQ